jgi:hypothetical protein
MSQQRLIPVEEANRKAEERLREWGLDPSVESAIFVVVRNRLLYAPDWKEVNRGDSVRKTA